MQKAPDTLWPTNNRYDIPALLKSVQADALDMPVMPWGSIARSVRMPGTYHFYTDDYRFRALIRKPEQLVATECVTVVEPNFSVHHNMPFPVVLYRTFWKRWLARFWQGKGIRVFVDLNVPPEFLEINLLGVPDGWTAYATRGYNARINHTLQEHDAACERAGTEDVLFVVFGGGAEVQEICIEHAWLWIPEHADTSRGRVPWRNPTAQS